MENSNKKLPLWIRFFYGRKANQSPYGSTYIYGEDSIWGLITHSISTMIYPLELITAALICLKLCGTIELTWFQTFIPILAKTAIMAVRYAVEYVASCKRAAYIEAERQKRYESIQKDRDRDWYDQLVKEDEEEE